MSTTSTGLKGEEIAVNYLKKLGYQILERNFRIQGGEIDIIAKDKNYLVFIEVKTRYNHEFGKPKDSITPKKIGFLIRTAKFYLLKTGWGNEPFRLDFISIDFTAPTIEPEIELIKNITE